MIGKQDLPEHVRQKLRRLVTQLAMTRMTFLDGRELSIRALSRLCGTGHTTIAQIERMERDGTIATWLNLLEPLGKTLAIVDIEEPAAPQLSGRRCAARGVTLHQLATGRRP